MPLAAATVAQVAYSAYQGYAPTAPAYANIDAALTAEMEADITAVMADPALTGRQVHQARIEARVAAGWQYGLQYDPVAKTDPYLVDYDALPDTEKMRYKILAATAAEASTIP